MHIYHKLISLAHYLISFCYRPAITQTKNQGEKYMEPLHVFPIKEQLFFPKKERSTDSLDHPLNRTPRNGFQVKRCIL